MPIFDDSYLQYLRNQGEIELSTDLPCIFHRVAIDVVSGTPTYTIPSGFTRILWITWKGETIFPLSMERLQKDGIHIDPFGDTSGKPRYYIVTAQGLTTFRFWPTPNETISAGAGDLDTKSEIESRVIVAGYRVADPTGNTYRLPEHARRRIIKYYVNMRAYLREGKSINMEASQYFKNKYEFSKGSLRELINLIPKAITYSLRPSIMASGRMPRPVLPSQFGEIVE